MTPEEKEQLKTNFINWFRADGVKEYPYYVSQINNWWISQIETILKKS